MAVMRWLAVVATFACLAACTTSASQLFLCEVETATAHTCTSIIVNASVADEVRSACTKAGGTIEDDVVNCVAQDTVAFCNWRTDGASYDEYIYPSSSVMTDREARVVCAQVMGEYIYAGGGSGSL